MPGLPQLDATNVPWRGIDGAPSGFAVRRGKLYTNYVPTAADTLTLGVYRMPLAAERMDDEADEPVIPAQFHEQLIHWALYRAFSRPDSELNSAENAAARNALFEAAFGRSSSARGRALNQEMSSRPSIAAPPYGGTRSYNRTFNW
jgi:hypothetical protein